MVNCDDPAAVAGGETLGNHEFRDFMNVNLGRPRTSNGAFPAECLSLSRQHNSTDGFSVCGIQPVWMSTYLEKHFKFIQSAKPGGDADGGIMRVSAVRHLKRYKTVNKTVARRLSRSSKVNECFQNV